MVGLRHDTTLSVRISSFYWLCQTGWHMLTFWKFFWWLKFLGEKGVAYEMSWFQDFFWHFKVFQTLHMHCHYTRPTLLDSFLFYSILTLRPWSPLSMFHTWKWFYVRKGWKKKKQSIAMSVFVAWNKPQPQHGALGWMAPCRTRPREFPATGLEFGQTLRGATGVGNARLFARS